MISASHLGTLNTFRVLEALSTDTVAFLFAWFLVLTWNSILEEKNQGWGFGAVYFFVLPSILFSKATEGGA